MKLISACRGEYRTIQNTHTYTRTWLNKGLEGWGDEQMIVGFSLSLSLSLSPSPFHPHVHLRFCNPQNLILSWLRVLRLPSPLLACVLRSSTHIPPQSSDLRCIAVTRILCLGWTDINCIGSINGGDAIIDTEEGAARSVWDFNVRDGKLVI